MHNNKEISISGKKVPIFMVAHCLIGVLFCVITSFLFAVLISSEKLPCNAINVCADISIGIGAFIASVLSSCKYGKAILTSTLQCILYIFALYCIGIVTFSRIIPNSLTYDFPVSCLIGSFLAAILSAMLCRKIK